MAGIDTLRGIAFQLAQALGDVIDLVVDSDGDAVVIEGADDVIDYEVLDRNGRRRPRRLPARTAGRGRDVRPGPPGLRLGRGPVRLPPRRGTPILTSLLVQSDIGSV